MKKNYRVIGSDPGTGNIYCPIDNFTTIDCSLPIGNKVSDIAEESYLPDSERFSSKFIDKVADYLVKMNAPWFIHTEDNCTGSLQYGTLTFIEEGKLQILTFLIDTWADED